MNWFDKWIYKKLKQIVEKREKENRCEEGPRVKSNSTRGMMTPVSSGLRTQSDYNDTGVFNLRVYGAIGGHIIESTKYNIATDNERTNRYIVASDTVDLGTEIGKIITMESMR